MILSSLPAGTKTSYTCLSFRSIDGQPQHVYVVGDEQDSREQRIDEWIIGQNTLRAYSACRQGDAADGVVDMVSQPIAIGKHIGPLSITKIVMEDKPCTITIRSVSK